MTVWIAKHTGAKTYHTDKDCRALKGSERTPIGELTDDWTECQYCAGEFEQHGGPSDLYLELAYE